ncbi:MAG TPA: response regulator transcription factor [Nocardioides sp.]|nr:response regulator transcription factor [Nocardioides sp.]
MGDFPVRVVLALTDHDERAALASALAAHGCTVCGAADAVEAVVALAVEHRPDIALLDVELPGRGISAAREIARRLPASAVVMIAATVDDEELLDCLRAGATGYLPKDIAPERLVAALRGILDGEAAMPRRVVGRILEEFRAPAVPRFNRTSPAAAKLSAREWEVMELLAEGLATAQVARRLFLSPNTVRVHVSSALRKLRVTDRESAIALLRED